MRDSGSDKKYVERHRRQNRNHWELFVLDCIFFAFSHVALESAQKSSMYIPYLCKIRDTQSSSNSEVQARATLVSNRHNPQPWVESGQRIIHRLMEEKIVPQPSCAKQLLRPPPILESRPRGRLNFRSSRVDTLRPWTSRFYSEERPHNSFMNMEFGTHYCEEYFSNSP